jgi:hypothetical protein
MPRFDGFVEKIGEGIDVRAMREWVLPIPLADWPEAPRPTLDPYITGFPAIVNMPDWHGFAKVADGLIDQIRGLNFQALRDKKLYDFKISTMVPGQFLGTHAHGIGPDMHRWCFRVHAPVQTNSSAFFIMDKAYHLEEGSVYIVNVARPHAVVNHGDDRRIHFMFEADDG